MSSPVHQAALHGFSSPPEPAWPVLQLLHASHEHGLACVGLAVVVSRRSTFGNLKSGPSEDEQTQWFFSFQTWIFQTVILVAAEERDAGHVRLPDCGEQVLVPVHAEPGRPRILLSIVYSDPLSESQECQWGRPANASEGYTCAGGWRLRQKWRPWSSRCICLSDFQVYLSQ